VTHNIEVPDNIESPHVSTSLPSSRGSSGMKPPTPDKKKKKGLFGGLFGKKKRDGSSTPAQRAGSRSRVGRKVKG